MERRGTGQRDSNSWLPSCGSGPVELCIRERAESHSTAAGCLQAGKAAACCPSFAPAVSQPQEAGFAAAASAVQVALQQLQPMGGARVHGRVCEAI